MGHRTITISDEAHDALARSRLSADESFTKVILRLTSGRGSARSLLEHVKASGADEELAAAVETTMQRTRKARLGRADF